MKHSTPNLLKFKKLARRLNLRLYQAIGLLEALWHSAILNAPQGDIGKLSNEEIAASIDYEGNADELVSALKDSHWLDEGENHRLFIHDWSHHAPAFIRGNLVRAGLEFADKLENEKTLLDIPASSELIEGDHKKSTSDIQPTNLTKPNLTKPNLTQWRSSERSALLIFPDWIAENEKIALALVNFLEHRKEMKKPVSERAFGLLIPKLERLSGKAPQLAVDILNQSVESDWQGIFDLKGNRNNKNNNDRRARAEAYVAEMPPARKITSLDEIDEIFGGKK